MARRLACLPHFYRRIVYEGFMERNPIEFADRPKVPEQAATAGLGKQRARRLITAARAEGPREILLVLLLIELGLRVSEAVGADIEDLGEQIGLPHPHALRHAFVTLSLDEGASLRDVQDAARHADPRTTRRYDKNRTSLNRHPSHRLLGALEP
jgi:site-specific recombinase XerD